MSRAPVCSTCQAEHLRQAVKGLIIKSLEVAEILVAKMINRVTQVLNAVISIGDDGQRVRHVKRSLRKQNYLRDLYYIPIVTYAIEN